MMMPMMKRIASLALIAAALAAPATAARRTPDEQLAKLLEGRVAQAPVNCINPSQATSTQIVAGKAIVYGVGSRLYVNVPRGRAETMRSDDILITRQFGSQLCRNDQVQLLERGLSIPRGIILLGDFVPYVKADAAK